MEEAPISCALGQFLAHAMCDGGIDSLGRKIRMAKSLAAFTHAETAHFVSAQCS